MGWIATSDTAWFSQEKPASIEAQQDQYTIIAGTRASGVAHDMIDVAQYIADDGKLISWHGGTDNLHPAKDHQRMLGKMLSAAATIAAGSYITVEDNAQFLIVPGAMHSSGGYPAVDWLTG